MNTPVSFKLAKLLKEKVFDIPVLSCYFKKDEISENYSIINQYEIEYIDDKGNFILIPYNENDRSLCLDKINFNGWGDLTYSAPTIAEVVMWCFNKYKYSIEYSMNIPESGEYDGCYVFNGLIKGSEDYKLKIFYTSKDYPTAEKALEDTINHFLINFF